MLFTVSWRAETSSSYTAQSRVPACSDHLGRVQAVDQKAEVLFLGPSEPVPKPCSAWDSLDAQSKCVGLLQLLGGKGKAL